MSLPVFKVNVYFKGHTEPVSISVETEREGVVPSDAAKGLYEFFGEVKQDGWAHFSGKQEGAALAFPVDQISHFVVLP